MPEIYIVMLFSFLAPIVIFCLFWKFKKPLWSIVVWLPLLLYSIIKTVFDFGVKGYDNLLHLIYRFIHSESIIAFYFWWLPSIVGFLLINIIYLIIKNKSK